MKPIEGLNAKAEPHEKPPVAPTVDVRLQANDLVPVDVDSVNAVPGSMRNTVRDLIPERDPRRKALEQIADIQDRQVLIEQEFLAEFRKLRKEFHGKLLNLTRERISVMNVPKPTQNAYVFSALGMEFPKEMEEAESVATQAVPGFWMIALMHHPALAMRIEDHDRTVLMYLENVWYEWDNTTVMDFDHQDFTLVFKFAPNPFFSNMELRKTFRYVSTDPVPEENEPEVFYQRLVSMTTGTEIVWRSEAVDVTKKIRSRQQRNKKTGAVRTVKQEEMQQSFFHFFDVKFVPPMEELAELGEDLVDAIEERLSDDFEMGVVLRDKIIPRVLGWYLGTEKDTEFSDISSSSEPTEYNSEVVSDVEDKVGDTA